jgi:hypothetical protein
MFRFYATAIIAIGLFASTLACSQQRDIRGQLDRATARFHERYNAGRMNEIYELSSNGFKATHAKDDFTLKLALMRTKVGEVQSSERIVGGDKLTWQPTDMHPIAVYNTTGTKGDFSEHFTWDISGDEAILDDYYTKDGHEDLKAK